MRDEGLDDAIDLEIEKVRRTTCRTDFSEGLLDRVIVCGKLADPAAVTPEPFVFNNLELLRVPYHAVELRDGTRTPWRFQRQRILFGMSHARLEKGANLPRPSSWTVANSGGRWPILVVLPIGGNSLALSLREFPTTFHARVQVGVDSFKTGTGACFDF